MTGLGIHRRFAGKNSWLLWSHITALHLCMCPGEGWKTLYSRSWRCCWVMLQMLLCHLLTSTTSLTFFSFFPCNFWSMTWSLDPDAVSDTVVYTARSHTHFCVGFSSCPKTALAGFATYFAWEFKLSWLSYSLYFWTRSLSAWSFALIHVPCITLLNCYIFTEWCSLCSVISLLRLYILYCWFCFCLFCATTDGFSFPTQQQAYPELEMDF